MKRFIWVALVTLLLVPAVGRGETGGTTIGPTALGLVFVNSAESLSSHTRIQRGLDAGAKLDRFPLYWDRVEPTAGSYDWSRQDAALRANEERGLGTLAILLGTSPAHWPEGALPPEQVKLPSIGGGPARDAGSGLMACSTPGTPPARGLYEPIFSDGTDTPATGKAANSQNPWARYVEQAVTRYRPGGSAGLTVRHWEIWNEPDLCHFWGGSVGDYARLLKVAYLVIKNIDSQATVLWGGLALYGPKYEGGDDFLNDLVDTLRDDPMAAAHNGFFDAPAIHQYSTAANGYYFPPRVRAALAGTGWQNKPIWVTESGVPVCDGYPGPDCPSPYRANPAEQAAYIWQNIAYTRLAGTNGPIFHFQLHDDGGNECRAEPPADGFGLVTNEPGVPCVPHTAEPRPAYRAYQLAAEYLSDTELLWADVQPGWVRRVAFYHPATKERRLLVWATSGSNAEAKVPAAGGSARRLTPEGGESTLTPLNGEYALILPRATNQNQPGSNAYTIGGRPYLLIERDTLPPTATIPELPPASPTAFEVRWQVADWGSGVVGGSVEVWVRAGEGAWQPWLTGQGTEGSALFQGTTGVRYRFAVQATDRAGNARTRFTPLTETRVGDSVASVRVSGQVHTLNGQPAPWALVAIGPAGTFADATGHFAFEVPVGRWDVRVQHRRQIVGRLFLATQTFDLVLHPATNPLFNGDFEVPDQTGLSGWEPSGSSPVGREPYPSTQDHALRLATAFAPSPEVPGDGGNGGNATISQEVTVPTGVPHLAFFYQVESEETDGGNGSCSQPGTLHDKFEVIVVRDGVPEYLLCQEGSSTWQPAFLDLSAYAGQTVRLIFNLYESSATRRTSALVDRVMLGTSPVLTEPRFRSYLPLAGH